MTGTWLPIAGAALGAGALPWMWANKAAAAGGMVGGYGADAISKILTGKDWGNLVASNTPLTPEMAQWVNPGTWVGGAVGGVTPQMRGLQDRYSLLNFKYNTHPSVQALEDEGWKYSYYDNNQKGLHSPKTSVEHWYFGPDKTEMLDTTGGVIYVPNPEAHRNPQLHFNPTITYRDKSGYWNIVDSSPEKSRSIREAVKLLNVIGDRVPLSQDPNAATKAQVIQQTINNGTWKDKLKYLLTGKYDWSYKPYKVDGYSTDIYPTMKNYANKGIGTLEKSVTTRLHGTNIFGESFKNNNLQRYFGEPKNGEVYFSGMTPRQVEAWNAEQADTYGMHIDPKTRTSEQYIFVTGKDKPTYEEPSNSQDLTKGTLLGGTLFGKYALDLQNATTNLQQQLVQERNSPNNSNNKKQQLWDVY